MFCGDHKLQSLFAACNYDDQNRRIEFCEQFMNIHETDPSFAEKMPWTDEIFETNGIVN
jgi:hypothetical protein